MQLSKNEEAINVAKKKKSKVFELKRCPFCGNEALLNQDAHMVKHFDDGRIYYVSCSSRLCGIGTRYLGTKKEVISGWNLRKNPVKKKHQSCEK